VQGFPPTKSLQNSSRLNGSQGIFLSTHDVRYDSGFYEVDRQVVVDNRPDRVDSVFTT
jgi:hypothetical protein